MTNTERKVKRLIVKCEFRRLPWVFEHNCAMIFGSNLGIHEVKYYHPRNRTRNLLTPEEKALVFIEWFDELVDKLGASYDDFVIETNSAPIRDVCKGKQILVNYDRTFKITNSNRLEPNVSFEKFREYYQKEIKDKLEALAT